MSVINKILSALSSRRDFVFLGILITMIGVMIVPVPPALLDLLIAANLTLTVTVLLVSVYLDRATSFSTFPAVILIATTFRLAISISTTRSVLAEANGGEIVNTFGHFATSGNIAIGLVVFLIISIVQFVVITKGAERVAEVAARFTLDALPGRQMSIDAELRNGSIDLGEARARRQEIDKENQFFGAMDGAMKFVKGDAITGLLIVAVNLVGGLVVGVGQRHLSFSDAAAIYSLLTIGDGLVAQLPALIIAMSAGIIITRVTTADTSEDLGSDIARDLTRSVRSLKIVGLVIMGLGLVPGFPASIFCPLGACVLGYAWLAERRRAREEAGGAQLAEDVSVAPRLGDRVVLRVGGALYETLDLIAFAEVQARMRAAFEQRTGIPLPRFGLLADVGSKGDAISLEIDGVPLSEATLTPHSIGALADQSVLDVAGVAYAAAGELSPARHVFIVSREALPALQNLGINHAGPEALLVEFALGKMAKQASRFIGFEFVQSRLQTLRAEHPELADQVAATVATARSLDVMRRLAAEGVPLRPMRAIFECLVDWAPRQPDTGVLTEFVRRALAQQICFVNSDQARTIPGYVLSPDFEQALRACLRQTEVGEILALAPVLADLLLRQVSDIRDPLDPEAPRPVLIVPSELRRHIKGYLADNGLDIGVLSTGEIAREFTIHPVGALVAANAAPSPKLAA